MDYIHLAPPCGLICSQCQFFENPCNGCGHVEGKPFWTTEIPEKICPIYDCCRNKKELEHCGLCKEFPCKIFLELRDPNASDKEFKKSLSERKKRLRLRKKIGTEQWLWDTFEPLPK
jgi:hypothetical protein